MADIDNKSDIKSDIKENQVNVNPVREGMFKESLFKESLFKGHMFKEKAIKEKLNENTDNSADSNASSQTLANETGIPGGSAKNSDKKRKSSYAMDVSEMFLDRFSGIFGWLVDHLALTAVCVVAIIGILIAVAIIIPKREDTGKTAENQPASNVDVTDEELSLNSVPEVNSIIEKYYRALAEGDAETLDSLCKALDETAKIRVSQTADFIEDYTTMDVYTKPGPTEGSYVVFAHTRVKFYGSDAQVPGMQTFYVCKDENGEYYINDDEVSWTPEERKYVIAVDQQDDVIDLNNRITVEFNDLVASDSELNAYLMDVETQIQTRVGEILAEADKLEANALPEDESTQEDTGSGSQEIISARATTKLNVRSSDSENADKVGQIDEGAEVTILENRANGWSRVKYADGEAYVKTEYLVVPEDVNAPENAVTGTVTAIEGVNVREKDNSEARKLGLIDAGTTLDMIKKQDNGWTKVVYNGTVAYVKSEYLE